MEKKTIMVEILGQECKIVANSPEEENRIHKTIALIQGEMKSMIGKTSVSQVTALLYTTLNIGDRLFREMESTENLRDQISENAEQIAKLERELQKAKKPKEPKEQPKGKSKGKKEETPEPPPPLTKEEIDQTRIDNFHE